MLQILAIAAACSVTEWNSQERLDVLYMTGATTCSDGWLRYQIRDLETDEFYISGEALIQGFTFQEYTEMPYTDRGLNLRYSISVHEPF